MTSSCPCCASTESRLLFSGLADRLFRTSQETFDLRECARCQVIFLEPAPRGPELARFYPAGYWWQTTAGPQRVRPWHRLLEFYRRVVLRGQVRKMERLVGPHPPRGARLLDIGCGDGVFLDVCSGLPLARVGLDQSLGALQAARQRGGLELAQAHVEALPFAGESFYVITMFHVLEHVPDPSLCLQEVRRLLSAGGWLVVQVPNAGSLQRRLMGRRWAGFDVPRHLANYTPRNLRALLERNGFRIARQSHFSLRDNAAIPVMSLLPRLYPPARRLASRPPGAARAFTHNLLDLIFLCLVLLTMPLAWGESLLGRGGTVVVTARKA